MATRRHFIKLSTAALAAVPRFGTKSAAATATQGSREVPPSLDAPKSEISVWFTDAKRRFTPADRIPWQAASATASPIDCVQLVPANRFQEILGFGGCFTDASCYLFSQLQPALREQLIHEMFDPSQLALSVNRTCVGSTDSA